MANGLLVVVGSLELKEVSHALVSAAGFGLMSVFIARWVTRLKGLGAASA